MEFKREYRIEPSEVAIAFQGALTKGQTLAHEDHSQPHNIWALPLSVLCYNRGNILAEYMKKHPDSSESIQRALRSKATDELSLASPNKIRYPRLIDSLPLQEIMKHSDEWEVGDFLFFFDLLKRGYEFDTLRSLPEVILERSYKYPGTLLNILARFGGNAFPEKFDSMRLKSYCDKNPEYALHTFCNASDPSALFPLLERSIVEEFSKHNPVEAINIFCNSGEEPLLDLFCMDALRDYIQSGHYSFRALTRAVHLKNFEKLCARLNITDSPFDDSYPTPPSSDSQSDVLSKIHAAMSNDHRGRLSDEETQMLASSLTELDNVADSARSFSPSTVGIEIEPFNLEPGNLEIRSRVIDLSDFMVLFKFLSTFSVVINRKTQKDQKDQENGPAIYPFSNLHISFGITVEEERNISRHLNVFSDICYVYACAYLPLARIAYLEHGAIGSTRDCTLDSDILPLHPEQVARFQNRFLSVGGNSSECKTSLYGIYRITALLSHSFSNISRTEQIRDFLRGNTKLQNTVLEMKWVIAEWTNLKEEIEKEEKKMPREEERIKGFDQKNVNFRFRWKELQKELQTILHDEFGDIEGALNV